MAISSGKPSMVSDLFRRRDGAEYGLFMVTFFTTSHKSAIYYYTIKKIIHL